TLMSDSGIGAAVRRKEDFRFLTGKGNYVDDINRPNQSYAYLLRSPHAHAALGRIDTSKAKAAPGVIAVFTGEDIKVGSLPCGWVVKFKDGSPQHEPPHPVLAQGKVRHVGDTVAVVIADTKAQAKDAAELIEVEYKPLPAVIDMADATKSGAALVHDAVPNNICFDWAIGDEAQTDAIIANAMEPRAAVAEFDRGTGEHLLFTTSQNPHAARLLMGAFVLQLPEHKLRVVAPDVGGGFGSKIFLYPEECILVWASALVNRPIKWTAERSESFASDAQGRDHITHAELALDKDG